MRGFPGLCGGKSAKDFGRLGEAAGGVQEVAEGAQRPAVRGINRERIPGEALCGNGLVAGECRPSGLYQLAGIGGGTGHSMSIAK